MYQKITLCTKFNPNTNFHFLTHNNATRSQLRHKGCTSRQLKYNIYTLLSFSFQPFLIHLRFLMIFLRFITFNNKTLVSSSILIIYTILQTIIYSTIHIYSSSSYIYNKCNVKLIIIII